MTRFARAQRLRQRIGTTLPGRTLAKFKQDRGDNWAIVIAFNLFSSLVPLIGSVLTIVGVLARNPATLEEIRSWLLLIVPAPAAQDVARGLESTGQQAGLLGLLSLIGLLWTASGLFRAMAEAFDVIFAVPDRPLLHQLGLSLVTMLVFAILLLLTVGITAATHVGIALLGRLVPLLAPTIRLAIFLAGQAIALLTVFLLFLAWYWLLPNRPFQYRDVWPGALVGAVGFILLGQVFPLYLQIVGDATQSSTVFGLILLVMVWFQLIGRMIVLGAELNSILLDRRDGLNTRSGRSR